MERSCSLLASVMRLVWHLSVNDSPLAELLSEGAEEGGGGEHDRPGEEHRVRVAAREGTMEPGLL